MKSMLWTAILLLSTGCAALSRAAEDTRLDQAADTLIGDLDLGQVGTGGFLVTMLGLGLKVVLNERKEKRKRGEVWAELSKKAEKI